MRILTMSRRNAATPAALLLIATATALSGAGPASAEPNPYTPERVCGSGFHVIDRQGINGGIVYLLYKSSTSQNCVTTIKTVRVGTRSRTSARIQVRGESRVYSNSGDYRYYAGPVRLVARHRCVQWGGATFLAGYLSPFEHCS